MRSRVTKARIDALLLTHAIVAGVSGAVAFVFPHLFEWFMIHHGEALSLNDNDPADKITHLVTRIYGALILAQAWITWNVRRISDAHVRRALVQAYAGCFILTTLALVRAQVTEGGGFNSWNWVNIGLFASLSCAYSWFAFFERIAVFESLDRMML